MSLRSLAELEESPAGARVVGTQRMPAQVCMLVRGRDQARVERLDDGTILVSHSDVVSELDDNNFAFALEALATLADMVSFNVRNQMRFVIGDVRFRSGQPVLMAHRVFEMPEGVTEEMAKHDRILTLL